MLANLLKFCFQNEFTHTTCSTLAYHWWYSLLLKKKKKPLIRMSVFVLCCVSAPMTSKSLQPDSEAGLASLSTEALRANTERAARYCLLMKVRWPSNTRPSNT